MRKQAQALDGIAPADRSGLLFGVPVGIKDIFDTADMPTEYGSPIYAGHEPRADAACVAALKRAGALIVGKTVTTEFAAMHPGATINPHDPARTPGGSSSGSAAAVAAGMVPAALGTQTVGSIVRPAAFCGVIGYKPTFNLINRAGLKPLSESTDTIGVLADRVDTAARFVAAMSARPALAEPDQTDSPPRLAVVETPAWPEATDDARAALEDAAQRLREAGADVEPIDLPASFDGLQHAGRQIFVREAAAALGHEVAVAPDLLSDEMRELVGLGSAVAAADYDAAQALAMECRRLSRDTFAGYDAILALSAPGEASEGLSSTGSPSFNGLWTLLHVPCINLPGLVGSADLPIGVQLVGAAGGDAALLRTARWAEGMIGR